MDKAPIVESCCIVDTGIVLLSSNVSTERCGPRRPDDAVDGRRQEEGNTNASIIIRAHCITAECSVLGAIVDCRLDGLPTATTKETNSNRVVTGDDERWCMLQKLVHSRTFAYVEG
jgi:hypothetical protein